MLRLLLSLLCGLAIAVVLLMLRQQRVELQHACNDIHDEMLEVQTELWRQQVQIATATAPAALEAVLANHTLETEPEARQGEAQQARASVTPQAEGQGGSYADEWGVYEAEVGTGAGAAEVETGGGWQVLARVRE